MLEATAANILTGGEKDEEIKQSGPYILPTTMDLGKIECFDRLVWSRDAGTYFCNEVGHILTRVQCPKARSLSYPPYCPFFRLFIEAAIT